MKLPAPVPQTILYNGILATRTTTQPNAQAVAPPDTRVDMTLFDGQIVHRRY